MEGMLKEPRNINPVLSVQDADRDISRLIFSGLMTYAGNGELKPDLAEKFEISSDGKTYTIFLRKEVKWHDGKPLKADDVLFTIQMIQNPLYRSPLRTNWQGVNAEKVDDYTLRLNLRTAYAQFVENLTVGIVPKHLWQNINPEQAPLHELNLKPVGSGPYEFSKFKQNKDGTLSSYEVVRNSNYYREGPYLKKITFIFLGSVEEAVSELRRRRIEGFGPLATEDAEKIGGDHENYFLSMPRVFGIFFNRNRARILEEKTLREAFAYALNKKEIAAAVSQGGVVPIELAFPYGGASFATEGITVYEFNPEKSKKILAAAGWKDENADGVLERKKADSKKSEVIELTFTLTTSDWPDLVRAAKIIKEELKEVGINIDLDIKPFSELESGVIRPRNFDLLLFGQVYGYEPDPFAFWHSSQVKDPGLNVAFYTSREADKLLEEARKISASEKRVEKYRDLQKQIAKDLPAVFLYSQLYLYALPTDIRGVNLEKISLPADRFNEINLWYKETKRVFK